MLALTGRTPAAYAVRVVRSLTSLDAAGGRRTRGERGAIAIMTGLLSVVLLVVAAFSVDIGNAWAVRGMLQKQVDLAATDAAKEALPVTLSGPRASTTQLAAAKWVAFRVACDTVRGQRALDPSIPDPGKGQVDCAGDGTQNALDSYAARLLSSGMVTFPTTTTVAVRGPSAQVDFGFGHVAGNGGAGEQKSATARVYSPGTAAPVALGLQCTLTAAGALPVGAGDVFSNAVPLNYIAAGALGASSSAEPLEAETRATMPDGEFNVSLQSIVSDSQSQGVAAPLTVTLNAATLPATAAITSLTVNFYRGSVVRSFTQPLLPGIGLVGTVISPLVTVPPDVSNTAGTWYVQVVLTAKPLFGPAKTYTTSEASAYLHPYTVSPLASARSLTACANLIDSPRQDTGNTVGAAGALRRNIKEGMDHTLRAHGSLATLNPPGAPVTENAVNTLLNNSPSITNCAGPGSYVDNDATRLDPLANCVNIASDGARQDEFTQGFLADPSGSFRGRLSCDSDPTGCSHGSPFSITGMPGLYNDDKLDDFKNPGSILNSSLFFSLSTYLTDNVPALSPPSTALKPDLYSSPRFFWTAVASRTPDVPGSPVKTACQQCPVLTFRPVFLTQDAPTGIKAVDVLETELKNLTGSLYNAILPLFPFLDPTQPSQGAQHGIIFDSAAKQLRALRFQTMEPTSLPVPPIDYNGPVSDYLGVGPKVVRLVK